MRADELGAETLAFIEQNKDGLKVEVSACPRRVFQELRPEQIEIAKLCMTGSWE